MKTKARTMVAIPMCSNRCPTQTLKMWLRSRFPPSRSKLSYRFITQDKKEVAVYQVVVKKKSYSYQLQKRFSDFVELKRQFEKEYQIKFDNFPSKITFYKSKEDIRKERKTSLEKFLNYLRLVAIQNMDDFRFPELYNFLEMGGCRK